MRGNISKNKNGQGEMIQTLERFDNNKLDTLTDVGVYAVSMPFDNVSSLYYLFVSVQASEGTDDSGRAYVTNTYSQFLMSSDALKSRSKTIKTYKDDETQSVGEWSEWKTTEGAITKTVKNYEDIDSCCDGGVYFVEGRTDQISEGSTETLIVSSAGRVFCQHYFYYDGRVEYRQQQNGKWSNWKSVGITSYNDLTDKPNLSKVATSGSYEDLTGKPDLSDYATKESLDKILIPGSEKIVDRAENDDEGNNIRLTYATKEKLDNLIVFGNVVARAECDDLGNKIRLTYATKEELKSGGGGVTSYNDLTDKPNLSKVATSGSYKDLSDKPIIESISDNIPHDYNKFTTEGIYILREPYKERYKLLIVVTDNDHYDNETNNFYGYVVTQYLFSTYGVTKRMNIKDKWTKWEPVGGTDINVVDDIDNISGDDEFDAIPSARAVKIHVGFVQNEIIGYIDRAIGDVETSLENIIEKYGLGGDGV